MENVVFVAGKWAVYEDTTDANNKGVKWIGGKEDYYKIGANQLAEIGHGERANMYDFCIQIAPKNTFLEADIYAFNTALLFALDYFKIGFNPQISWKETLKEQQRQIELKPDKDKKSKGGFKQSI